MDSLVAACGGLEKPFTVNGIRWLYCWHPASGRHVYLNLDLDIATWNPEFHPAFNPVSDDEYEEKRTNENRAKLQSQCLFRW
jgi:hypothetical protein